MPIAFQYLTADSRSASGAPRGPDNTVGIRFKRSDLAHRPVIRDELRHNMYLVFESRAEFAAWYAALPAAERACHEVVFGWQPQRLKFDVDAAGHKLDALPDSVLDAAMHQRPADDDDFAAALDEYLSAEPEPDAAQSAAPNQTNLSRACASRAYASQACASQACASRAGKIHAIVSLLIEAILDELYVAYYAIEDLLPSRSDLAVTDSSGATADGWKYSYHIVTLPYYVADCEEAREFTARVLDRLPPPLRPFVDAGVNKSIQNFRLAGSAKPGSGRFKVATGEFGTCIVERVEQLMVTAPAGARTLARVYTDAAPRAAAPRVAFSLNDPAIKAVLDMARAAGVTDGHSVSEIRSGSLICFTRDAPTHCRICGETHRRDNSLMLSIEPVEGGHAGPWPGTGPVACRVLEHCRQARGRARTVGELTLDAAAVPRAGRPKPQRHPELEPESRERIAARIAAIREGRVNPHDALASAFERLPDPQKTVYAEPQMRPYELVPTLAVAAQMKLGKTKALRAYLDAYFPADGIETKVVRFVTFRQTFSRALTGAFPDFVLYSDVQGDLTAARHPRAIVQVESLHRLRMPAAPEPVDLLVLDEVESILAQFNSGLHRHFAAAFAMFQWMMRTARHVVCMDANLSDRTFRTLERLRPAHPPRFHWNRYARAADDAYFFTADQAAWLEKLYAAVRAGQRIVLPTNSLSEAKAFDAALRREFPKKRVMLYSSETAPSEKVRHFGDVHTYWGDLDVLIYTPTCSAGVSFELEHFDTLFGYFCDASCDVETCRQMLGRVRNLRTREHYLCLRAIGAALPTEVGDIRRAVFDKRAGLYRDLNDAALQFEYSPDDGSLQYHESDYFHMWLETVRMVNLSRNDFAVRFIDQVADTGAAVSALPAPSSRDGAALLLSHRAEKSALKGAHCDAVASAADITAAEAHRVRDALREGADVAPALLMSYQRWHLREAYAWHGRPLDADFVALYGDPATKRVYRNLIRITEGATVLDSLRRLQEQEAGHYSFAMETRDPARTYVNESRDLLRERSTYQFQAHYLAIWLLRACGFSCITDKTRRVSDAALEARLRSVVPMLRKNAERIVAEFEIHNPNFDSLGREPDRARFLSRALRTINAILRMMYGIYLKKIPKRAGGDAYCLAHNAAGEAFVFGEPSDVPHIPSKLLPIPPGDPASDLFIEETFYAATDAVEHHCDSGEPALDSGEPAPDSGEPAPDSGEPAPDSGEPAPDSGEPAPDSSEPALDSSEPALDSGGPAPDNSELQCYLEEILGVD